MRTITTALVLFVSLIIGGCSTIYRTPGAESLAQSDLAVLEHDPSKYDLIIEEVDEAWRGLGMKNRYELTPGTHSLGIRLQAIGYTSDRITLWFDAKTGRTYVTQSVFDAKSMKWWVAILEKDTGERVDRRSRQN
jgi:hypothetical protein